MNDYLYDVDEAQYSFVRVPKLLLQHEAYQRISSEAKLLYSLLLDRVGLSHKNGWRDKQTRIYHLSDRRGHGGNELRKEQSRTAFG